MIELKLNSSADLRKEGKSFYWASFFLPKSSKKNAGILYSICRYFDDIADKHSQDQSNYLKNSIEEIKNLYFAAAGSHPGAGIPGVLSSAKVVENIIKAELK